MNKILRYLFSKKTMVFYHHYLETFIFKFKTHNEFIVRQLRPSDYQKFSSLLTHQRNHETVFKPIFDIRDAANRIRDGEYCIICEHQGQIVGYLWYATHKKYIQEIQSTIHLAADEVYLYNGYVRSSYRGQNIAPILRNGGCKELIDRGFKREIASRMSWNLPVERALLKSHFKVIGPVTVGFFLTFRYMINKCNDINLTDEGNPFEFYFKLLEMQKRFYHKFMP